MAENVDENILDATRLEGHRTALPRIWRIIDHLIVRSTEFAVFFVGIAFVAMITLEVVARYGFDFSIFIINAAARLLLVWFFMLGAGLALRHGAHVGFELFLHSLPKRLKQAMLLFGQILAMVFFAQMLWSAFHSLGPALRQTEPGLDISLFWAMLAFPVGFGLLAYHLAVLVVVEFKNPSPAAGSA
jgi:TRAP-type transport system small permease protein